MKLHSKKSRFAVVGFGQLFLATLIVLVASRSLQAQSALVYVDAKDHAYYANPNLYTVNGSGAIGVPLDGSQSGTILNPDGSATQDGVWGWRNFGAPPDGDPFLGYATVYASEQEDSPAIIQRLGLEGGGLDPGKTYDVYAVYWSDSGNWSIRGKLSSAFDPNFDPNTPGILYDNGDNGNATPGSLGTSAAWSVLPFDNPTDDNDPNDPVYPPSDSNDDPFVDASPGAAASSTRNMLLGLVATAQPNASGFLDIIIDDQPDTGGVNGRTFFDGLAYVEAGNQVFATGTLDRDTGTLSVNNPTSVDFQVVGYELLSTSGSLNGSVISDPNDAGWLTETNNGILSGGASDWTISSGTSVSELSLAESDDPNNGGNGTGETFSMLGGSIDFGRVWRRGISEDVVVRLFLDNGQTLSINPEYTGTAITAGDFDADGDIDSDDYISLVNGLHVSHATTSLAYSLGDITGDGLVNRADVVNFQSVFDGTNGVGAFAQMLASLSVPEPSTALLLSMGCGALVFRRRRRNLCEYNWELSSMKKSATFVSRCGILIACLAFFALPAEKASAALATGWARDNLVASGNPNPVITEGVPGTVSIGELTSGDPNNLFDPNNVFVAEGSDDIAIWASTSNVHLENGNEINMTGQVTLIGANGAGNQAFRFGLFKDSFDDIKPDPNQTREEPTVGWLGYLAGSSGAGNDGLLSARNPDNGGFFTNISPLSTFGQATERGETGGRVFYLAQGGSTDNFPDGKYSFEIRIGRYNEEVTVEARMDLLEAADGGVQGDFDGDGDADGQDFLIWQRGDSPLGGTQAELAAWEAGYGTSGPTYTYRLGGGVDSNLLPEPIALDPNGDPVDYIDHVTFDYDRVGFLFANHLNTDYARLENVDISQGDIEALGLSVNRATGEVTLNNATDQAVELTYYEISSASESLDPNAWNSLAGGPTIDGIEWDQAAGSDSGILSEINLAGTPLAAPASTSNILSFGNIFDTGGTEDLSFFFTTTEGLLARGVVTYFDPLSGAAAVPEPASIALLGLGLSLAGVRRRSRG